MLRMPDKGRCLVEYDRQDFSIMKKKKGVSAKAQCAVEMIKISSLS